MKRPDAKAEDHTADVLLQAKEFQFTPSSEAEAVEPIIPFIRLKKVYQPHL